MDDSAPTFHSRPRLVSTRTHPLRDAVAPARVRRVSTADLITPVTLLVALCMFGALFPWEAFQPQGERMVWDVTNMRRTAAPRDLPRPARLPDVPQQDEVAGDAADLAADASHLNEHGGRVSVRKTPSHLQWMGESPILRRGASKAALTNALQPRELHLLENTCIHPVTQHHYLEMMHACNYTS